MRRVAFLAETAALAAIGPRVAAADPLPAWQPGALEIHHLSTGRGNSTLVIGPDATAFLIDAGAATGTAAELAPARPDATRAPGTWIGRYVRRRLTVAGRDRLDAFVVTHYHNDHLDGLEDVAAEVPIARIVDRSTPDYVPTSGGTAAVLDRYRTIRTTLEARGTRVERAEVGSTTQLTPRAPRSAGDVVVRILAAGGCVCDGARAPFGDVAALAPQRRPSENAYSIALRLAYGPFRYYTGGDLLCDDAYGAEPLWDVETPAVRACGPVDVATVDHHGYYDAAGPAFVRALRPQAFVVQAWHATHPAPATLERLLSPRLGPPRDVFTTTLAAASRVVNARLLPQVRSSEGHVVVRVAPGGARFEIAIVDDANEADRVTAVFGPYRSRLARS